MIIDFILNVNHGYFGYHKGLGTIYGVEYMFICFMLFCKRFIDPVWLLWGRNFILLEPMLCTQRKKWGIVSIVQD